MIVSIAELDVVDVKEQKNKGYSYLRWENYSVVGSGMFEEADFGNNFITEADLEKLRKKIYESEIIKKWRNIFLTSFFCVINQRRYMPDFKWKVEIALESIVDMETNIRTIFREKMLECYYKFDRIREYTNWKIVRNTVDNFLIFKYGDEIEYSCRTRVLDIGTLLLDSNDGWRRGCWVGGNITEKIRTIKRQWQDGSWLKFDLVNMMITGEVSLEIRRELKEKLN